MNCPSSSYVYSHTTIMISATLFLALLAFSAAVPLAPSKLMCPPEETIAPCMCEEPTSFSEAPSLYCDGIVSREQMKNVTSAPFPKRHLRRLDLSTCLVDGTITSDLFGELKIEELYLMNDRFNAIAPDAFSNFADTLRILNLEGNELRDFPYEILKSLTKLHSLWLGSNMLSKIPEAAFGVHQTMVKLDLANNHIQSIGKKAFSGLAKLQFLWMEFNQLSEIEPESFHFNSPLPYVTLYLANNKINRIDPNAFQNLKGVALFLNDNDITELDKNSFQGLIDNAAFSLINVGGNILSCNCSMVWAMDSSSYMSHFISAQCSDNTPMNQKHINC